MGGNSWIAFAGVYIVFCSSLRRSWALAHCSLCFVLFHIISRDTLFDRNKCWSIYWCGSIGIERTLVIKYSDVGAFYLSAVLLFNVIRKQIEYTLEICENG